MDFKLRKQIEAQKWFHALDFGDFTVPSYRYPAPTRPNNLLLPVFQFFSEISLPGMRCLDMGTFDGMAAFVLDRMGAGRIEATCQHDRKQFRLAHEALKADRVVYHPKVEAEDLIDRFGEGSFDMVLVSLALHYFMLPQEGLFICRRLLKRNGLFVLAAGVFQNRLPVMFLNTEVEHPVGGIPTTWIPSDTGLEGMLRLACFDQLARIDIARPRTPMNRMYTTIVSKAVSPDDVRGRSQKLVSIHDTDKTTGRVSFPAFKRADWPVSSISYNGPPGRRQLDISTHVDNTPLQPRWTRPVAVRAQQIPDGEFGT